MGIFDIKKDILLELYIDYRKTMIKDTKDSVDHKRIANLSAMINKEYDKLSDTQKIECVHRLYLEGLVPESWVDLCDVFNRPIMAIA